MSDDLPDRARRAFRQHDSLAEPTDDAAEVPSDDAAEVPTDDAVAVTSTPFDATISASDGEDGNLEFHVTVRVPVLSEVVEGDVAEVVEDGWADTFRRRVENIGAVTEADRDLSPEVSRDGSELVAEATLRDLDHKRGTNDAVAVVDYVEGTYVQGVIPGYEYTEPVSGLLNRARAAGGSDGL
jgi:hypothetical protein